jgi:hypothetical protein
MIETLALSTFKSLLPASVTFKTKFLLAFLITNTLIILVMFLLFLVFGRLKRKENEKL